MKNRLDAMKQQLEENAQEIAELKEDYDSLEGEYGGVRKEFAVYKKEKEKDALDGTDYKKLSQRFAKSFQKEHKLRAHFQDKLHVLATPDEMQRLVQQDEYDRIVERLQE